MSMKTTDVFFAGPRLPAAKFINWVASQGGKGPYQDWVNEMVRVTPMCGSGMDDGIPAWQAAWESANFTSSYWVNNGNSGGIGITYSGQASPFSVPNNGKLSAHIHLANLWILLGKGYANLPTVLLDVKNVSGVDAYFKKVQSAASDPNRPKVNDLADLCLPYTDSNGSSQCTYACDPSYATGICGRANNSGVGTPDQGGTAPPPTAFAANDKIQVSSGPLNLRSGPGTTYAIVESLATGAQLCVTGGSTSSGGYTWYPVKVVADGKTGDVAGQYCALVAAQGCASGTTLKTTASVNVRTGPNTTYASLGVIAAGTIVTWDGSQQSGGGYTWDRCATPVGTGWIANAYLTTT